MRHHKAEENDFSTMVNLIDVRIICFQWPERVSNKMLIRRRHIVICWKLSVRTWTDCSKSLTRKKTTRCNCSLFSMCSLAKENESECALFCILHFVCSLFIEHWAWKEVCLDVSQRTTFALLYFIIFLRMKENAIGFKTFHFNDGTACTFRLFTFN